MTSSFVGSLSIIGLALIISVSAAVEEPSDNLGLTGSKHDFTRFGLDEQEGCLACHAPSKEDTDYEAPLWDGSADAGRSYKLYDGSSGVPSPSTMLCLSCHDGSSAIDAFGGTDGEVFLADIADSSVQVGEEGNLTGDHPVGVGYPAFDRDYVPGVIVEGDGRVPLPEGRVECISCHEPHGLYGHDYLLVKSNVRSALCLTCHRK